MKKALFTSTLILSAMATAAFGADLALNTDEGIITSTDWNWGDSANWLPAGSTVTGSNLTLDGVLSAANTSTIDETLGSAGDVKISVGNGGTTANAMNVTISAATTFNNLTIDNTGKAGTVAITNAKKLTITNDLNVVADGVNAQTVKFTPHGNGLTVSGNVNITNNKATDVFFVSGATNLGVVTMKAAAGADGAKIYFQCWSQTFGGLSDGGIKANHVFKNDWGGTLAMVNKVNCSWSGMLDGKALDLAMASTATATQRFEISSGAFLGVTVTGGRLELAMASTATDNGALNINGGIFNYDGDIKFATANFDKGKLNFTNDSGTIIVTGATTKSIITKTWKDGAWVTTTTPQTEKFVIDFEGLTEAGEYDIISMGSKGEGFSENANDDFAAINLQDGFNVDFSYVDNMLKATITVPEPATIAAILGALALAFAIYRRRP